MALLYVLPQVMLYFNLVIWLSLRTGRGALPLTLAALAGGNLLAALAGFITCGFGLIAVPLAAVGLAGVFRDLVLVELEELAGQG